MDELLEVLASKSNCFISDLKADQNRNSLMNVLNSINPNEYSSTAWMDAFLYIIGKSSKSKTNQAIKEELLIILKEMK